MTLLNFGDEFDRLINNFPFSNRVFEIENFLIGDFPELLLRTNVVDHNGEFMGVWDKKVPIVYGKMSYRWRRLYLVDPGGKSVLRTLNWGNYARQATTLELLSFVAKEPEATAKLLERHKLVALGRDQFSGHYHYAVILEMQSGKMTLKRVSLNSTWGTEYLFYTRVNNNSLA